MTITLKRPRLPRWRPSLPRVTRDTRQNLGQTGGAVVALVGIAQWSVGAALLLGGLGVILAIERQA